LKAAYFVVGLDSAEQPASPPVTQPDSMINIPIPTAASSIRLTLEVDRRELTDLGETHSGVRRARRQVVVVDIKRNGGNDRAR
jgi:hypothetical protein